MKKRNIVVIAAICIFICGFFSTAIVNNSTYSDGATILNQNNVVKKASLATNAVPMPENLVEVSIKHYSGLERAAISIADGKKEYTFAAGAGITVATFNPTLVSSTAGDLLFPRWAYYRVTIYDGPLETDPALIDGSVPVWTLVSSERGYKITSNLRPLIENEGPGTSRTLAVSVSAFGGMFPFKGIARFMPGFKEDYKTWQIKVNFE